MKIKVLFLTVVLAVGIPAMSLACSLVPSCPITTAHGHVTGTTQVVYPVQQQVQQVQTVQYQQVQPQIVVQPRRQFNMIDMVESMVYVSGGVTRVAGDYYAIRGMGHADDYAGMWNKRYKYGLDTRARTEYGVQSYDRRNYGGYRGNRQVNIYNNNGNRHRRPIRHNNRRW